jgi:hypothetical protein
LSSTKLGLLVRAVAEAVVVVVAGLAAEAGVVDMAAEAVVEEAVVAVEAVAAEVVVEEAGIAVIAAVEAAATGAGSCHPTIRICNETGESATAGSPVSFSGLPGISLSSMLSLGYSYGNAICGKHPRRSL